MCMQWLKIHHPCRSCQQWNSYYISGGTLSSRTVTTEGALGSGTAASRETLASAVKQSLVHGEAVVNGGV